MSDTEKLATLLLRWEESWEHGQDIPARQLCADSPELADQLQARIDGLKQMAWVKKDVDEGPEDEATRPIALPKVLANRYRLDGLIAEGGFGRVYRGFDNELQRAVAIKIARPRIGSSPEPADLLEEARKVARLRHPGIVSVHDIGREGDLLFIIADLIEGENLADLAAKHRPSPTEAARIIAEVAEALHYAHEQGFIHRDIKPANILMDKEGKAHLADFGIASTKDDVRMGKVVTMGTLPYTAPEQVAGEVQLIDARTDLYSLGVVFYELLTGRQPYQARTPTALREQILFRPALPIRSAESNIPPGFEAICQRCLAKHPADRFATAKELAEQLRAALSRGQERSHRRLVVGLLGVLGIVCLAVLAWKHPFFGREPQASDSEAPFGPATPLVGSDGVLALDGNTRLVTPLERFAPVTLEAWVRPEKYEYRCHFVIGSDIPKKYGIGLGICGVLLSAEYIEGFHKSDQTVPLKEWSHIAAVFAEDETRLYFNGKKVATAPATQVAGGTPFVIGNVGQNNPIDYFIGRVRAVRISKGARYTDDFIPEKKFEPDGDAVLLYTDFSLRDGKVLDQSGHGNHGTVERLGQNSGE